MDFHRAEVTPGQRRPSRVSEASSASKYTSRSGAGGPISEMPSRPVGTAIPSRSHIVGQEVRRARQRHRSRRRRMPGPLTIRRHGQRRPICEQPVRRLAVITERFAMVGGDDDHRAVQRVSGSKPFQQASDHRVGVGHLGVVRGPSRTVLRRGVVRRMRIEEVHPRQPWARGWLRRGSSRRPPDDVGGPTLGEVKRRSRRSAGSDRRSRRSRARARSARRGRTRRRTRRCDSRRRGGQSRVSARPRPAGSCRWS